MASFPCTWTISTNAALPAGRLGAQTVNLPAVAQPASFAFTPRIWHSEVARRSKREPFVSSKTSQKSRWEQYCAHSEMEAVSKSVLEEDIRAKVTWKIFHHNA
jgi:hypothetical protein